MLKNKSPNGSFYNDYSLTILNIPLGSTALPVATVRVWLVVTKYEQVTKSLIISVHNRTYQ